MIYASKILRERVEEMSTEWIRIASLQSNCTGGIKASQAWVEYQSILDEIKVKMLDLEQAITVVEELA